MKSSLLLRQLKHPEQYRKTEGIHFHQAHINKSKLLLLPFNVLHYLCPEPLRMRKTLGQVKDLASKEHSHLSDELPSSNRMEIYQLSEHAGASVLKLYGDDGREDKYRGEKRFNFLICRFCSSRIIRIEEV